MYHQIDTIAYPKSTKISKSTWKDKILSTVTLGFFGKSKEKSKENQDAEHFSPLSHQEMINYCLERYLLQYKEMLCSGCIPEGFNIDLLSKDISFVYNSLRTVKICPTTDPLSRLNITDVNFARTDFKKVRICWRINHI